MPMWGHVNPMIPIARELLNNGHQVEWFIDDEFHSKLKEYNIPTIQTSNKFSYSPIDLNLFNCLMKARRLIKQAKTVLVDWSLVQYAKLDKITSERKYEAVLTDCIFIGSLFAAFDKNIPRFVFGVIPYPGYCKETGPYGIGWRPSQKKVRILLNRAAHCIAYYCFMKPVYRYARKKFQELSIHFEFKKEHFTDTIIRQCQLFLQGSLSDFEYDFAVRPKNVHFIGPSVLDECKKAFKIPKDMDGRPLIFVSQGTVQNTDASELIQPCCEALKNSDVYLVVSLEGAKKLKGFDNYGHIEMKEKVEYPSVIPTTDIFITNGGYGGVNLALKYGVPVIVAGRSDDKGEVGARVEWAGVGINLRTSRPKPRRIRKAVERIRNDPSFKKRAMALRERIIKNDAAKNARLHIEQFFTNSG